MSRRDTKWFAPPSGGYSAEGTAKRGAPPKNPSSTSAGRKKEPVQKIVLVVDKIVLVVDKHDVPLQEFWEAVYREFTRNQ